MESFGIGKDGQEAVLYTITNHSGARVKVTNYGCAVVSIEVPDRNGKLVDVALGCPDLAGYEQQTAALGGVPGRHANRIEGGRFTLNETEYSLCINNGPNHLHGGKEGFHQKFWNHSWQGDQVVFSRLSPDGEEGYPGNLMVRVAYSFDDDNQLLIEYDALSDADTVINLTNHTYFNLSGEDSGSVLHQQLKLYSTSFTENDENCLPTGTILPVADTPFDFTQWKEIGKEIGEENIQLHNGNGYDHNFILEQEGEFTLCAEAYSPDTDIHMAMYTTQPGVQLYTANFIQDSNVKSKSGKPYEKHAGFCLEAQHWPNAMAHKTFPTVVLRAGERYQHVTAYEFSLGK